MKIKTAEILCVGTEILLGDIVNTNAAYLSRELAGLGIAQYRQSVIGDNSDRLEETVRTALQHCDLLIMTGGLGPTYDDITKETVARVFGKKLTEDPELLAEIMYYFKSRGRVMTENNKKQAMVIEDSTVLKNSVGTAPGTLLEQDGKVVVLLPGPPSEMTEMWSNEAKPIICKYCEKILVSRNINIVGMGESSVEEKLRSLMENAVNPTVAPYCKTAEVRLRVTASADTREEALKLCNDKIREISRTEVGPYIYGLDTTLPETLVKELKKQDLIMATAESCTGGLISKMITDVPGSSDVFYGGVVSYANRVKMSLLQVSQQRLESFGAVSGRVASKMAEGACQLIGADISVAVTGIAGPGGGTEDKPVGLVYIAVCYKNKTTIKKYKFGSHQTRERIRELTATYAFIDVLTRIKE